MGETSGPGWRASMPDHRQNQPRRQARPMIDALVRDDDGAVGEEVLRRGTGNWPRRPGGRRRRAGRRPDRRPGRRALNPYSRSGAAIRGAKAVRSNGSTCRKPMPATLARVPLRSRSSDPRTVYSCRDGRSGSITRYLPLELLGRQHAADGKALAIDELAVFHHRGAATVVPHGFERIGLQNQQVGAFAGLQRP